MHLISRKIQPYFHNWLDSLWCFFYVIFFFLCCCSNLPLILIIWHHYLASFMHVNVLPFHCFLFHFLFWIYLSLYLKRPSLYPQPHYQSTFLWCFVKKIKHICHIQLLKFHSEWTCLKNNSNKKLNTVLLVRAMHFTLHWRSMFWCASYVQTSKDFFRISTLDFGVLEGMGISAEESFDSCITEQIWTVSLWALKYLFKGLSRLLIGPRS